MSSFTPQNRITRAIFVGKPAPIIEALEGILAEKGLPYTLENKQVLTLPNDGLTIQVKMYGKAETAVQLTPVTADNALLAQRLVAQLGEQFTEVTQKAAKRKRRNWILGGVGTAVLLCLAAVILIPLTLYRSNQPPPLLWRYDVQGDVAYRPFIANGAVYYGTLGYDDSYFGAVNLADGTKRWQVSYGRANIFSWATGLTSNNLVLFSTDAGYFYALDADTGEEVWVFGPEDRDIAGNSECNRCGANFRTPLLVDDVVYLPSHDHHVYALDATTGRELWRFGADGTFLDTPSVANNLVYAGNMDGNIYILDANTGQQKQRISAGRPIYEALPDGQMVYAVVEGSELRAFDVSSGELLWQYGSRINELGSFSGHMALHDDKLILMSSDRVYAINKETGKLAWDFAGMERGVFWEFTVADGRFYVGDSESYLYVLDADTGKRLQRSRMTLHDVASREFTADPLFPPAIHDGKAYFGWFGQLYAIELNQ